jgi:hypothetical protein
MTAEILLVILACAATVFAAGVAALILAAFGGTGWFVILAFAVAAALAWRLAAAHLEAKAGWAREDLRDDWRAG